MTSVCIAMASENTTGSTAPAWSKRSYGAVGKRYVLIILSEDDHKHPDAVERRQPIELTEELKDKLENQGVPREDYDDLSLIKTRYSLDKRKTMYGVEMSEPGGETITKSRVLKRISTLMSTCTDSGDGGGGKYRYYNLL